VGCARCHDHKFDPISMQDYYALHGVFASSREPDEKPLLGGPLDPPNTRRSCRRRRSSRRAVRRSSGPSRKVARRATREVGRLPPGRTNGIDVAARRQPRNLRRGAAGRRRGAAAVDHAPARARAGDDLEGTTAPPALAGTEVRRIIARHWTTRPSRIARAWPRWNGSIPERPRGRWLSKTSRTRAIRASSSAAIRVIPAPSAAPLPRGARRPCAGTLHQRQWPPRTRPGHCQSRQSSDRPGFCEPRVGLAVRNAAGATPSDFGVRTEAPETPGSARLAGRRVHGADGGTDWRIEGFKCCRGRAPARFNVSTLHPSTPHPWSIKHLHRLMVRSNTYRQSSVIRDRHPCSVIPLPVKGWPAHHGLLNHRLLIPDGTPARSDPENRLLHHFPRRRLDFEPCGTRCWPPRENWT